MNPSTNLLTDDEDNMELMYPEQDSVAVGIQTKPLPIVD